MSMRKVLSHQQQQYSFLPEVPLSCSPFAVYGAFPAGNEKGGKSLWLKTNCLKFYHVKKFPV